MSQINKGKSRLGRGLNSLISVSEEVGDESVQPRSPDAPVAGAGGDSTLLGSAVVELPIHEITPNPHQPRRSFNDERLKELAASIRTTGLIQPILVRQAEQGFELIAGERRLRAAKLAGLETIAAIVKEVDRYTQAQMALIENVQREDLNPMDRAQAYRSLVQQLGLTQTELAGRLGEDRSTIANHLRLLDLPEPVRELIRSGQLSLGHAKLLAGVEPVEQQVALAERSVADHLSVRALELAIQAAKQHTPPDEANPPTANAHLKELERTISGQLGMRVQVRWSPQSKRGKLIVHYASLDQFDQLKARLGVSTDD